VSSYPQNQPEEPPQKTWKKKKKPNPPPHSIRHFRASFARPVLIFDCSILFVDVEIEVEREDAEDGP